MVSITRWAKLVHGQPNTNEKKEWKNEWFDVEKATSFNGKQKPTGFMYSSFDKTYHNITGNTVKDRPETITAINFDLENAIPKTAYITKIIFKVRMMVKGNISVRTPHARFNMYGGRSPVETYREDYTGWLSGFYYFNPNKKITNTWQEIEYVMNESDFHKRDYPIESLFEEKFGIDLVWHQPTKQSAEHEIRVSHIGVTIDYVTPNHKITFDVQTSGNNPRYVDLGKEYAVEILHVNDSKATDEIREIQFNIPNDIEITEVIGDYDTEHNTWAVKGKGIDKLILKLKNWDMGLKTISLSENIIGNYNYYVYGQSTLSDVGDVKCYAHDIHKGHKEYIDFKARVNSHDGQIQFNVDVDDRNPNTDVEWELTEEIDGVSIDDSTTNNLIVFNVPVDITRDISFRGYFISQQMGETTATIEDYTVNYNVLQPYQYIFSNNIKEDENVCNLVINPSMNNTYVHRGIIRTNLKTPIIECSFANNLMEIGECTLHADIFDKINYIGKVVLKKITQCNPKSKLTNKLIRESGKNHLFLGKEGDINEDISLTTYVRPADSVTLQGYAELDEPVPINANHECFEGDPLNHKGWAELTGVEIEETNPLWYKVNLDVTYITHDLNTKFEIVKGNTEKLPLPTLFTTVFELGENLSEATDIFEVDTDGGFIYDDANEIDNNNIFNLANSQNLLIKTKNTLANVFEMVFDWMTVKNNEDNQNKMSRVFKLIDLDTGNSIMEYEYTDITFNKDANGNIESITATTILRGMDIDMGQNPQTHPIELQYEILDDEDDIETNDKIIYGSTLRMEVNQNKLKIVDEGFNGREIEISNVELVSGNYIFLSEWTNGNDDGGTEDIISYINIELNETLLNSTYSEYYDKLVISPFPIPKKQLVFTRESDEGTIYYYRDDNYPFKYRLEPFYQFLNGTNLVTRSSISLFNLNNSYSHFYIENGLVRMGFNKYNGELYLAKYDVVSKSWVTTHYFKMRDDIKFQLALLSSDKITIKAGDDSYFSIWRGHPFIAVSHPTDVIHFDNHFTYIYGDNIDNTEHDLPVMFSLLNTDNLLPIDIGGRYLNYKDITIDDDYRIDDVSIELNLVEEYVALQECVLKVNCASNNGKVHYFVDGEEIGVSDIAPFDYTHIFSKDDIYEIQAVYVGDDGVGFSEIALLKVNQREDIPPVDPDVPTGKYKLEFISAPSNLRYRDNKTISFKLKRGDRAVKGATLEVQKVNSTITRTTNENGIVTVYNNEHLSQLGTYIWACRFYTVESGSHDKLVCQVSKRIRMLKGNPYFALANAPADNIYQKNELIQIKLSDNVSSIEQVKVSYRINNNAKKTKTTNDNGNFFFKFNKSGTYVIKVYFAGNKMYNSVSDTYTIRVV